MFHLAEEWGRVEKALPTVKIEKYPDRVLTPEEERLYFRGANSEAMEQDSDPSG
jgi:hypothetical protein